jgi:hypothetical protein
MPDRVRWPLCCHVRGLDILALAMTSTPYVHLARYGRKPGSAEVATVDVVGASEVAYNGSRYDLRRGVKLGRHPGFAHHLDGRYLQWQTRTEVYLEVVHPDGRRVRIDVRGGGAIRLVGRHLVYSDDGREPWLVIDAATGARLGRVTDMLGDDSYGTRLFTPGWFDPRDDRTLWLGEGTRLAQLDVAERRMRRTVDVAPGFAFVGSCAARPDGLVLALERPLEHKARFDRGADRLVVFGPAGERVREVAARPSSLAAVGDRFVITDDGQRRFVVYDAGLVLVADVPMHAPGRDGFNQLLALPSGREWIAIGGRGEWDHYGEPELAPTERAADQPTAPAKKPGVKKPARAARRR